MRRGKVPVPLADRFWPKVQKQEGCWKWLAMKNKGYGMIYPGDGKEKIPASRASWLLHKGPIPEGLHVLHSCDNPECTNPDHLFLGTHADNMRDKELKKRARPDGWLESVLKTNQRNRKVGRTMAEKMRFFYIHGASVHGLARMFQVDRQTVKRNLEAPPTE